jgi:hypothetical protein
VAFQIEPGAYERGEMSEMPEGLRDLPQAPWLVIHSRVAKDGTRSPPRIEIWARDSAGASRRKVDFDFKKNPLALREILKRGAYLAGMGGRENIARHLGEDWDH